MGTSTVTHTQATITTMATTTTDAALLQLIWLASPALPVGGFSYSEGLEAAVDCERVHDEATAAAWLADQLHLCLSRADLAVMADAISAWRNDDLSRIAQLDRWVLRTRETSEMRQQTEQMGRSLLEWLRTVRPGLVEGPAARWASAGSARTEIGLTYPMAFALAASASSAPVRDCVLSFAFGWAENMTQAAIKSVPLGQSAGQRILLRLAAEIPTAVDNALALREDDRQAFSPMLAILSAQHETQYSRLFRS
jgi:urease accessory protein